MKNVRDRGQERSIRTSGKICLTALPFCFLLLYKLIKSCDVDDFLDEESM